MRRCAVVGCQLHAEAPSRWFCCEHFLAFAASPEGKRVTATHHSNPATAQISTAAYADFVRRIEAEERRDAEAALVKGQP